MKSATDSYLETFEKIKKSIKTKIYIKGEKFRKYMNQKCKKFRMPGSMKLDGNQIESAPNALAMISLTLLSAFMSTHSTHLLIIISIWSLGISLKH